MVERVLYVGQPGTERESRFVTFLQEHFSEVSTASVTQIGQLDFDGVELAIVDGEPLKGEQPPKDLVAEALPVPTVLVGGLGGKVTDAIGLKLGWQYGCLCLDNRAIIDEASLDHAIFRGPRPVRVPVPETIATPENFLHYAKVKDVPEKLAVIEMHAADCPQTEAEAAGLQARYEALAAAGDPEALQTLIAEQRTPGLVSTSAGFFDSPDCERILGGINAKAHDYIAVGRQGRFLSWGFHGHPGVMTDLGKALFLNAVHYIAGFAGDPVEALRVQWSREMLQVSLGFLDTLDGRDPGQFLASSFGSDVPAGIGLSTAEALAWYDDNRGYLRRTGTGHSGRYEVDADLLPLSLANDDVRLLELLATLLGERGAEGDRARRLWQRYVRRDPRDAVTEQEWRQKHHDQLFFSDWAGYRWIARDELPAFVVPRTGHAEDGPVTVSVAADRDGDELDVVVSFWLRPGFYLYAPGAPDGVPVSVVPTSSHEVVAGPAFPDVPDFHLSGNTTLSMRVRGASDDVELAVTVQACDAQSCTPPATLSLRATAAS